MFDIGFWELCIIGVIALVILGPERLPKVARTAGLWAGRARRFMSEVKADIDAEIKQDEFKAIRDVRDDLKQAGSELSAAGAQINQSMTDQGKALHDSIEADSEPSATAAAADPADELKKTAPEN